MKKTDQLPATPNFSNDGNQWETVRKINVGAESAPQVSTI